MVFCRFIGVVAAVVVITASASGPAQAAKYACTKSTLKVKLDLKIKKPKVTYTSLLGRRAITRRVTERGLPTKGPESVLGLTVTKPTMSVVPYAEYTQLAKKVYCVRPRTIKARLGYDTQKVFIAKEYRKGSCEWYAIRKHEDKHVKIWDDIRKKYVPKVKKALKAEIKKLYVVRGKSVEKAYAKITSRLNKRVAPILGRWMVEARKLNAALDTKLSYKKVAAKCKNW